MSRKAWSYAHEIQVFEELLADEGIHLLKIFLHVGPKEQKKRLKALSSDPSTRWRVSEKDLERKQELCHSSGKVGKPPHAIRYGAVPLALPSCRDLQLRQRGALNALLLFFRRALADSPVKNRGAFCLPSYPGYF